MRYISGQVSFDVKGLAQSERFRSAMENRARPELTVYQRDPAHFVLLVVLERTENGMVGAVLVDGPNRDLTMHAYNLSSLTSLDECSPGYATTPREAHDRQLVVQNPEKK
jgi:hypothetical protein